MTAISQIDPAGASELMDVGTQVRRRAPVGVRGWSSGRRGERAGLRARWDRTDGAEPRLPAGHAGELRARRSARPGCRMGGRSMKACELLARAGYTQLANVAGGFGGAADPFGRLVMPGWMQEGLPVERESDPGTSYAALQKRAAEKA